MITLSLLHPLNKTPLQHWTFDSEDLIRIGRSTDNHVVLYSAVVSRYHVEVRKTDSGWEIQNIGTNGIYIEGQRIDSMPASDGIVLRLARSGPNLQINLTQPEERPISSIQEILARRQQGG
ncbi:MAG: FHA domain-containing protein [Leptolyngbya sp. SIO4C1]|nr:FHA domain-containing protein [Leptolyngbya sp. SIO4C1]